mmetsp:Transcript_14343/g.29686  ORF Transcript_14343/g.29686 Transcript_14343/m.29686 type:complete len:121 (+) Transcript_14343:1452-1814(+)
MNCLEAIASVLMKTDSIIKPKAFTSISFYIKFIAFSIQNMFFAVVDTSPSHMSGVAYATSSGNADMQYLRVLHSLLLEFFEFLIHGRYVFILLRNFLFQVLNALFQLFHSFFILGELFFL